MPISSCDSSTFELYRLIQSLVSFRYVYVRFLDLRESQPFRKLLKMLRYQRYHISYPSVCVENGEIPITPISF